MKDHPTQEASKKAPAVEEKIALLEGRLQELEKSLEEMKKKYLLASADLENYKKRASKERQELVEATSERLLRELIDVKDHLELALDHAEGAREVKPLHDGVTLTLKQMEQFLEKFGVTEIKSLGEPFDPAFHEAIQEIESPDLQPRSVAQEFQKGYLYQGRLLRPARVAIAKGKVS